MNVEISNTQGNTTNKALWQLVQDNFGVNRMIFQKTNQARLAKMANVSEEEYIRALKDKDKAKNIEYNIKIRDRILNKDILPLHEYTDIISKFDVGHQIAIKGAFKDTKINTYISNLSDDQIKALNKLTSEQLIGFLDQEIAGRDAKAQEIKTKMGIETNRATSEQIANLTELMDMQDRLTAFLTKNKMMKFVVNASRTFNEEDEIFFKQYLETQKKTQKDAYDKLIKIYGSEEGADRYIRYTYVLDQTKNSDEYKALDETAKADFEDILMDFSTMNQSLDIDISVFGYKSLTSDASRAMIDRYSKNKSYTTLVNNIYSDSDITSFFNEEENKLTEIVPEKEKDKPYYTKLLTFYPELDTTTQDGQKISEHLKYFNDDMTVPESASQVQKKTLAAALPILQKQAKPYENKLLEKTNTTMQNVAIEQCVATLEKFMDVDINEKDNIMEQMKIHEDADTVSKELVLHINGTMEGKKVKLSYNLANGSVAYQNFLSKQQENDQGPLSIGASHKETEVPLVTLPTLGDFVQGAKAIDYTGIIASTITLDEYEKQVTEKIQQSVKYNNFGNTTLHKDMLKNVIIKDMIAQSIFTLSGRATPSYDEDLLITKEQYPQSYGLYNYLYKSLEYYSLGSTSQLQIFQQDIEKLLQYRNTKATQSSENVMAYKATNEEMFVVQSLVNQTTLPIDTTTLKNQSPDEKICSFFKCFEKQVGGTAIIDIEMMDDYFTATEGTNVTENKVGKRARNPIFINLANDFDTKIAGDQASTNLEVQLKNTDI